MSMTIQELEKKQKKIAQLLEKHKYLDAKKALKQLEHFKPVSLKTYALIAKYYLLVEDYGAFLYTLEGKWQLNYAYEGIDEIMELYEQFCEKGFNERELVRTQYMRKLIRFIGTDTNEAKELEQYRIQMANLSEDYYLNGLITTLKELEKITYTVSDVVWNYLIQIYFQQKGEIGFPTEEETWIRTLRNMGYLKERLEEPNTVFILVAEEQNEVMCRAIGRILIEMGKKVWLLKPPKEITENIKEKELLQQSLDSKRIDSHGIGMFDTYFVKNELEKYADNRALVVAHLSRHTPEELATVMGSGSLLDDLGMHESLKKTFSRFNLTMGDVFDDNFSAGWVGDYTSYISKVYNYDVRKSLEEGCEHCKYSIVIPARNSVESLRYTIKTCLELDYPKEDYEIVVSDNSTNNNAEVYNLCQELQDARIKYYRTPRDLHLPKSFEYAFLQTRGEFILSIGSDDAVLPWALKVLDEVRSSYPDEEVIQWERGFYAWPGFNGGQQNQFVIPREYKQGEYGVFYRQGRDYMVEIFRNPNSMYALPVLYINSGFKRSYMNTLLEKTGRLWDGICQDIYIGVVNIIINSQILNLRYPLTIAGMTNTSVGATCVKANTDELQAKELNDDVRKTGNVGGFSMSMTERLMPELRSDVSSLYNSLLRAVARGILPEETMWQKLDWKKMFENCIYRLDMQDVEYDKLIHYARYTAFWHGEEFLQWFDETLYSGVMSPRMIDRHQLEQNKKKKTYQEGPTAEGGIVVDASRYSVTNSYEAAQLFCKLSNLI